MLLCSTWQLRSFLHTKANAGATGAAEGTRPITAHQVETRVLRAGCGDFGANASESRTCLGTRFIRRAVCSKLPGNPTKDPPSHFGSIPASYGSRRVFARCCRWNHLPLWLYRYRGQIEEETCSQSATRSS